MNRIRDEPNRKGVCSDKVIETVSICLQQFEEKESGTLEKKSFEYGGFHFYPLRKFNETDGDFYSRIFKSREDRELGFSSSDREWSKYPYNYEDFYKAAGGKVFDIFFCEENGKQYVPCTDELRVYLKPPIKNKSNRTTR